MKNTYSYIFSGNIIFNTISWSSSIYLNGSAKYLLFENNNFENIQSLSLSGGVCIFTFVIYYYFLLFY
jgi:hypothetical protein